MIRQASSMVGRVGRVMFTNIAKTESELRSDAQGGAFLENRRWPGDRSLTVTALIGVPTVREGSPEGSQTAFEGVHPRFHLEDCRTGFAADELDTLDFGRLLTRFGDCRRVLRRDPHRGRRVGGDRDLQRELPLGALPRT